MNHRPHAPHGAHSQNAGSANSPPADSPSHLLHPDSEHVRALLEELDDVVFQAIRGDSASLEQARTLWPQVVEQIGWELVEESREQYLRYSTDLTKRWEHQETRDPQRAIAAIEIIELLMRD
ncbi:MAG: hypothetical protein SH868_19815 [Bythopirellula sp.]|nr:hypothetical protein [Bythopirellula sp.]